MKLRQVLISACVGLCLLSAESVFAGNGRGASQQGSCLQNASGTQNCQGTKNRGQGRNSSSTGTCLNNTQISTLNDVEIANLKYMFEEEKLAGDVYSKLNSTWNALPFAKIAQATAPELKRVYGNLLTASKRHLAAFSRQLSLNGISYSASSTQANNVNQRRLQYVLCNCLFSRYFLGLSC